MKQKFHVVPEVYPGVVLISKSGTRRYYNTYWGFIANVSWDVLMSLGRSFDDAIVRNGWEAEPYWIAKFDDGDNTAINPQEIRDDYSKLRHIWRLRKPSYFRMQQKDHFEFRNGPVPCRGRHHSHRGSFYRHPRTTQERRQSLAWKEDDVKWRGARNFHNLPTVYDDLVRCKQKNWKKFRKHQWKD